MLDPIEISLNKEIKLKNKSLRIKLNQFLVDPRNWLVLKYVKAGPGGEFSGDIEILFQENGFELNTRDVLNLKNFQLFSKSGNSLILENEKSKS